MVNNEVKNLNKKQLYAADFQNQLSSYLPFWVLKISQKLAGGMSLQISANSWAC